MQSLEIRRLCGSLRSAKHVYSSRQQLLFPFRNLGGMDTEVLSQFSERLVAFDRGQGHLRREGRSMIPSRSFHCLAPLIHHHLVAFVKPGYHLAHCPNLRSPLCHPLSSLKSSTVVLLVSMHDGCFFLRPLL